MYVSQMSSSGRSSLFARVVAAMQLAGLRYSSSSRTGTISSPSNRRTRYRTWMRVCTRHFPIHQLTCADRPFRCQAQSRIIFSDPAGEAWRAHPVSPRPCSPWRPPWPSDPPGGSSTSSPCNIFLTYTGFCVPSAHDFKVVDAKSSANLPGNLCRSQIIIVVLQSAARLSFVECRCRVRQWGASGCRTPREATSRYRAVSCCRRCCRRTPCAQWESLGH